MFEYFFKVVDKRDSGSKNRDVYIVKVGSEKLLDSEHPDRQAMIDLKQTALNAAC
jgi:hypothetical protein